MAAAPISIQDNSFKALLDRARIFSDARRQSRRLRLWIMTGIVFMVLPGTILGVSALMQISDQHGFFGLSPAWIQAHGHAQVFGWIGSFVIGIGFYSLPYARLNRGRLPRVCWALWTLGLSLQWLAGACLWHWRVTLPLAGALQLAAILLFLLVASQHELPPAPPESRKASTASLPAMARRRIEPWLQSVLIGQAMLLLAIAINFGIGVWLATTGLSPALPHDFDQKYLVLLGWGFLAPLVWGFGARWMPNFLGSPPVRGRLLQFALGFDLAGVMLGMAGRMVAAAPLLLAAAVAAALAIGVFARPRRPAKLSGLHPSFALFLRIAFAWSIAAALLGVWASHADTAGGIWGGSRHALTVGFIAMMVMTVSPRLLLEAAWRCHERSGHPLPAIEARQPSDQRERPKQKVAAPPRFAGVSGVYSQRLMFATLALLLGGCTLRVAMEPLAYEGMAHWAWKLLPLSGFLELGAVLLFALQLILTLTRMPSGFPVLRANAAAAFETGDRLRDADA